LDRADLILHCVAVQGSYQYLEGLAGELRGFQGPFVSCSKGLHAVKTLPLYGATMVDVIHQATAGAVAKEQLCVLTGPSFARGMLQNDHTAVIAASEGGVAARTTRDCLVSDTFRVDVSDDVVGAAYGGAFKNVLGVCSGLLEYASANTKAAITCEVWRELVKLAGACGASMDTLMGPAGLGDVLLSVSDKAGSSRNVTFGQRLAEGDQNVALGKGLAHIERAIDENNHGSVEGIIGELPVVEGFFTIRTLSQLGKQKEVEVPTLHMLSDVVSRTITVHEMVDKFFAVQ